METIYYIDSENVGDSWLELLDTLEHTENKLIVFYTKHSPRMTYPQAVQLLNAANKPEFIECQQGSNALDFQLVSYLGYELCADRAKEMVIVSKDTGFDAVVHFWQKRGMQVKRVPTPSHLHAQHTAQSAQNAQSTPSAAAAVPAGPEIVSDCAADDSAEAPADTAKKELRDEEISTIVNCTGKKHLETIHHALVGFLGDKQGTNLYLHLKAEKFAFPSFQWEKEEKMKNFIALILEHSDLAAEDYPASISDFIAQNVVSKKNVMSNKLNRAYGAWGPRFHAVFKPFYKVLTEIRQK